MIRVMLIHCLNIILFINTGNVMKPTREIVKKTHFHTMTTIAVSTRKKGGVHSVCTCRDQILVSVCGSKPNDRNTRCLLGYTFLVKKLWSGSSFLWTGGTCCRNLIEICKHYALQNRSTFYIFFTNK